MFARLFIISGLAVFLSGCSSYQPKEIDPAVVEDLSDRNNTVREETKTYAVEESVSMDFNELDDPASPLSVRIIYFDYDSSSIRPEYRPAVEAHAAYLIKNPTASVTLAGHTDERGSREYNLALGEQRAQSLKQQLRLLGVSAQQVRLISYGEERPAVAADNEAAWQQNRRVEILY